METYIIASSYSSIIIFLFLAAVLWTRRDYGDRARILLMLLFILSAVNFTARLIHYLKGLPLIDDLYIPRMLCGLFLFAVYMVYPTEAISPGWVTWRRLTLWLLPYPLLFGSYYLLLHMGIELQSYPSLWEAIHHLDEAGAWVRLLICFGMVVVNFALYWVPYTRKYNNVHLHWMNLYLSTLLINVTAYMVILFIPNALTHVIYSHVAIAMAIMRFYLEISYRLVHSIEASNRPSQASDHVPSTQNEAHALTQNVAKPEINAKPDNNVLSFDSIDAIVVREELWRNPDLTLDGLAKQLKTNRTTLNLLLKSGGFSGYTHYINQHRVVYIMQYLRQDPFAKLDDVYHDAGYRSRITAERNFKASTGQTVNEFLKNS